MDENDFGYTEDEDDVRGEPLNRWDLLILMLAPLSGFIQGLNICVQGIAGGLHNKSVAVDRRRAFAREAGLAIESLRGDG